MADVERIQSRLDNIRSVEPILGAMRTISLGSWQAAIKRQGRVRRYSEELGALLPVLMPHLRPPKGSRSARGKARAALARAPSVLVLIMGSERGLCGAFNSTLVRYADQVFAEYQAAGATVEVATLGSRARRALERTGRAVDWFRSLPTTTLPTSELAYELARTWLRRYEAYELDAVDIVYHTYRSATEYRPITRHLIPLSLPAAAAGTAPWPPYYIDTDPAALYARLVGLWITTEIYRVLLDSTAAEHSARFQLMEGATQNANRLIEDLTLALQAARQQAITQEMQELAAGAGLLGEEEQV